MPTQWAYRLSKSHIYLYMRLLLVYVAPYGLHEITSANFNTALPYRQKMHLSGLRHVSMKKS